MADIRIDKPLKINGTDVVYVPKGVSIHRGGGKLESKGQIGGSRTSVLNQEEDFAVIKVEVENLDSNIDFFLGVLANGSNNTLQFGNESFVNATLMQMPDDQKTLETSEYEIHADSTANRN